MFVGIGDHTVRGLCGLGTAPSSFALRYGGLSLSCRSLTSSCVFQSFFDMSYSDHDFWLRELARTGLSASGQKELVTSLTKAVADREKYFPQVPFPYLRRVRQFLMAAFLPQKGRLFVAMHPESEQELLSRSQCWQLAHLELSLLYVKHRPVEGAHEAITEIIALLTSSDFSLTIPPRRLVELFSDLERMTSRRTEKMAGRPAPRGCWTWTAKDWQYGDRRCGHAQAYFDAVMAAKLTSMRSCAIWRTTKGAAVDNWPPSQVGIPKSWLIPRSSPCCPLMRMRLSRPSHRASRGITDHDFGVHFPGWTHQNGKGQRTIFRRIRKACIGTPKRCVSKKGGSAPVLEVSSCTPGDPRPLSSSPVDSVSEVNPGSHAIVSLPAQPIAPPYGTAPMSFPRVHYSLSLIMQNPLRHYPSVTTPRSRPYIRGFLPDGALFLDLLVFRAAFGSGETAKTFTRGKHDPAVCVLNAVGAQRVRAGTLEFCTWSEKVQQPEIFLPLFG